MGDTINNIKLSIIIPTYNRFEDLKITFESIMSQIVLPYELIIIDQSDDHKICDWVNNNKKKANFNIIYEHSNVKSLTNARTLGIEESKGNIILFLDDDVTLDKKYLYNLVESFKDSNIMGVQGYILNSNIKTIREFLYCLYNYIFFNSSFGCKYKGIYGNCYPAFVPKEICVCQWMSGCNFALRKEFLIKNKVYPDKNLIRPPSAEDLDFTYRVYKKLKNEEKLILNPKMKLLHRVSKKERLPSELGCKVKHTYLFYVYLKNKRNNFVFYWSLLGYVILYFSAKLFKLDFQTIKLDWKGIIFALKHKKEIETGKISEINRLLFNK